MSWVALPRVVARAAGVAALGFGLAGCALLPSIAPETFTLSAASDLAGVRGSTNAQILIPEPTALDIFGSERIVVRQGAVLAFYPGAQWADRLPVLVQTRMVDVLAAPGRARSAGRPGQGLSIDYALLLDLRSFEFVAGTLPGTARVEIFAQIMDDRNGRVLATRSFSAERVVPIDTANAVVNGLDLAFQDVLTEIANWTLGRI